MLRSVRSRLPKRAVGCFVIAAGLLAPATAAADLKMKWDCYLPNASVDCGVIEGSLTSKIPFLHVVSDAAQADVVVTITSVPAEGATRFDLHFVGKSVDGHATEVHTGDKIPDSIESGCVSGAASDTR